MNLQKYFYYKNKYIFNKKLIGGMDKISKVELFSSNLQKILSDKYPDEYNPDFDLKIILSQILTKFDYFDRIKTVYEIINVAEKILNILYIIDNNKELLTDNNCLLLIDYIIDPEYIKFNYSCSINRITYILYEFLIKNKLYDQIYKFCLSEYEMNIKINYYKYIFTITITDIEIEKLIECGLFPIKNDILSELFKDIDININDDMFIYFITNHNINQKNKDLIFLSKFLSLENFRIIEDYISLIDINNLNIEPNILKNLFNNKLHIDYLIEKGLNINNNIILIYITKYDCKKLFNYLDIDNINNIDDLIIEEDIITETKTFNIDTLNTEIILYHGSFNKINDFNINTPCFFSKDILQSLGHILIHSQVASLFKQSGRVYKNKKILDYYPLIYKYKIKDDSKVLILDKTWDDDFKYIFRPNILYKYLITNENIIEIINTFCNNENISKQFKAYNDLIKYYSSIENLDLDPELEISKIKIIKDIIIKKIIYNILKIYSELCTSNCFRSFINIPGYYLLTCISYNDYFNEIGVKDSCDEIIGLYIPNDQDEIILFNNEILQINDIIYIIPFSLLNNYTDNYDDIKMYISKYIELANNLIITDIDNETYIEKFELFENHIIKLGGKIFINDGELLNLANSWYFDYFATYCTNFNSRTHELTDCPKDEDGNELIDHKFLQYTDYNLYKYYINPRQEQKKLTTVHKIKNSKQSIYNISDKDQLDKYIELLETISIDSKLHLFRIE